MTTLLRKKNRDMKGGGVCTKANGCLKNANSLKNKQLNTDDFKYFNVIVTLYLVFQSVHLAVL